MLFSVKDMSQVLISNLNLDRIYEKWSYAAQSNVKP